MAQDDLPAELSTCCHWLAVPSVVLEGMERVLFAAKNLKIPKYCCTLLIASQTEPARVPVLLSRLFFRSMVEIALLSEDRMDHVTHWSWWSGRRRRWTGERADFTGSKSCGLLK